MAAHGLDPVQKQNVAFMTCILKVNTRSSTWQRTLMDVLNNVIGVSNFRMDEDGKVEVSGTVNPKQLLKMLAKAGKRAEVCWFQFGECSSNLYVPTPPQTPNCYYNNYPQNAQNGYHEGSCYGYGDNWHLRYEGYGPKIPFPHLRLPSPYGSASNGNALDGKTSPKVTTTQSPTSGKGNSCCSLM